MNYDMAWHGDGRDGMNGMNGDGMPGFGFGFTEIPLTKKGRRPFIETRARHSRCTDVRTWESGEEREVISNF